jgi:hypothetical protein
MFCNLLIKQGSLCILDVLLRIGVACQQVGIGGKNRFIPPYRIGALRA